MSTAVYLWDYLSRTMSGGFFLALSGGLDSSSVALMVFGMCKLVLKSIQNGEESTLRDLRAVTGIRDFMPKTAEEIVSKILFSAYMGTVNSGPETRSRKLRLCKMGHVVLLLTGLQGPSG
jgi:NAD+ synthase (glutamine-hydrolysing)